VSEDRGEGGLDGGDADDDNAAPPSIDKDKLVLHWPLAHLRGSLVMLMRLALCCMVMTVIKVHAVDARDTNTPDPNIWAHHDERRFIFWLHIEKTGSSILVPLFRHFCPGAIHEFTRAHPGWGFDQLYSQVSTTLECDDPKVEFANKWIPGGVGFHFPYEVSIDRLSQR